MGADWRTWRVSGHRFSQPLSGSCRAPAYCRVSALVLTKCRGESVSGSLAGYRPSVFSDVKAVGSLRRWRPSVATRRQSVGVDRRPPDLRILGGRLAPGALVVADTFASMAEYLIYVRTPAHGYLSVSFPVGDGMEISCRA